MKKILMSLSLAALMAMPMIATAQNTASAKNDKLATTTCRPCGKEVCNAPCNQGCNPQCAPCNQECKPGCAPQCKPGCPNDSTYCGKQAYGKKHKGHGNKYNGPRYGKQGKGKKDFQRAPRQNMLLNGIELTAEQQQKMKAFNDQQRADREKVKSENKAKAAKERQERMEAYDKEMKKILTPDQYKQYEANKEAMKNNRPNKKGRK